MNILLVTNSNESKWGSCKSIIKNLKATYQLLSNSSEIKLTTIEVNFGDQIKEFEYISVVNEVAEKITSGKYDRLVFVDDKVFPAHVLEGLSQKLQPANVPPVAIHVFGDFTFFAKNWSNFLLNHSALKINFITASMAQKKLIQNLLGSHIECNVFPFPLDEEEFFYSEEKRLNARKKFNLSEKQKVLLYSGRINLQKNVDILIRSFADIAKADGSYRLWIVGDFEDLGAPILGITTGENYMFHKIMSLVKTLPPEISERIKFWGSVEKSTLLDFYMAADLFVSLSLYHDEDFGMAPAEALMTGVNTVLTDWAGYSSFASDEWNCELVDAKLAKNGFTINKEEVRLALTKVFAETPRAQRAEAFQNKFAFSSTHKKLIEVIAKEPKMIATPPHNLVLLSLKKNEFNKKEDFYNLIPSTEGIYPNIYSSYLPEKESSREH